jgi:predicted transcriptional regulator
VGKCRVYHVNVSRRRKNRTNVWYVFIEWNETTGCLIMNDKTTSKKMKKTSKKMKTASKKMKTTSKKMKDNLNEKDGRQTQKKEMEGQLKRLLHFL